ncbi:hypothetical protein, partial [Corallococcus praedator]|uniref:hypothetical protein n=1 Tax=Corallococcus praedator TaxID=2316724 RepID=UPI001ABF8779
HRQENRAVNAELTASAAVVEAAPHRKKVRQATERTKAVVKADKEAVDTEGGEEVEAAPLRRESAEVTGRRRGNEGARRMQKAEVDAGRELK